MRPRWWISLLGAIGLATTPKGRTMARRAASSVNDAALRVVSTPTDRLLTEARSRVLLALPLTSDAKWRTTLDLLRGLIEEAVAHPVAASPFVQAASRYYAATVDDRPGMWTTAETAEAAHRLAESLDMVSTAARDRAGGVTLVTTSCPWIEGHAPDVQPRVCDLLCGPTPSLFAELAAMAERAYAVAARMGDGDARCLRSFGVLATPLPDDVTITPPPDALAVTPEPGPDPEARAPLAP